MVNKQDRKDRRSEEHIEKILRFYECIKHDSRPHKGEILSQDFHREREREGDIQAISELRDRSWDLWHLLEMRHCSARKRESEIWEGEKEKDSSKSDERLPPASVNIK